jgi:hypothetical protein
MSERSGSLPILIFELLAGNDVRKNRDSLVVGPIWQTLNMATGYTGRVSGVAILFVDSLWARLCSHY